MRDLRGHGGPAGPATAGPTLQGVGQKLDTTFTDQLVQAEALDDRRLRQSIDAKFGCDHGMDYAARGE